MSTTSPDPVNPSPPRRRRYLQISLRALLTTITILAIVLGMQVRKANNQRRATEKIAQLGGIFHYDDHWVKQTSRAEPDWLRRILGDEYFRSVALVYFNGQPVTDADLQFIDHLPGLETLQIIDAPGVTDAVIPAIAELGTLTHLDLLGTSVTDAALAKIARLNRLTSLNVASTRITDAGLVHLKQLPALKRLDVSRTGITDEGLGVLAELPALEYLTAINTPSISGDGLTHIARMPRIRSVVLNDYDGTRKRPISDDDLKHLAGCTLPALNVAGSRITDRGLIHLQNVAGLEVLDLADTAITDAGLAQCAALTNLRNLALDGTLVSDAGLPHLLSLRRLRSLGLNNTAVGDDGIDSVNQLLGLDSLRLEGTQITDASLKKLSVLTGLYVLRLNQTSITDAGLGHLKPLVKLGYLHVRGTNISDAGLHHLLALPRLKLLELGDTQVTPAGIAPLQRKFPNLIIRLNDSAQP